MIPRRFRFERNAGRFAAESDADSVIREEGFRAGGGLVHPTRDHCSVMVRVLSSVPGMVFFP